jgi:spore coat polysaccharide biosynthesis protein SpsF (cytidylyltransferase family)
MTQSNEISCAIVQMRMGSTRLPKKMIKKLCGWTVSEWVAEGVEASNANKIIYALPHSDQNTQLHEILKDRINDNRISIFFGDENNVFNRFRSALIDLKAKEKQRLISLIRVCGDRPLIQPENINRLIKQNYNGISYNHQNTEKSFLGYGVERLSPKLTEELFFGNLLSKANKEHITKEIYEIKNIKKKMYLG